MIPSGAGAPGTLEAAVHAPGRCTALVTEGGYVNGYQTRVRNRADRCGIARTGPGLARGRGG